MSELLWLLFIIIISFLQNKAPTDTAGGMNCIQL